MQKNLMTIKSDTSGNYTYTGVLVILLTTSLMRGEICCGSQAHTGCKGTGRLTAAAWTIAHSLTRVLFSQESKSEETKG